MRNARVRRVEQRPEMDVLIHAVANRARVALRDQGGLNVDGVRERDRKNVTTVGLTYPYAPWMIINFSRKLETKTSNLTGKDYWKYQTALQFTFIYK